MHKFLLSIGKLFVGRALSVISNMLILILVSRMSGPAGFGAFATILTTAMFSTSICKFGLEQVVMGEAPSAKRNRQQVFQVIRGLIPVYCLGIVLSISLIATFFVLPSFQEYFFSLELMLSVTAFVILVSYQFILGEFFRAREAFFLASLSRSGISNLIMLSLLVQSYLFGSDQGPDVETLWMLMTIAALLGAVILTLFMVNLDWDDGDQSHATPRAAGYFKPGFYFMTSTLLIFLVSQSDIWISAGMFGAAETGHYAAAARLILLTTFVAGLVNGIFSPKLAQLAKANNLIAFEDLLRAMSFINLLSGLIVYLLLLIFSADIIQLFFGKGFESSILLLRILLLGQVASIFVGPVTCALVVLQQARAILRSAVVGLVTGIGSVLIFSVWGLSQVELACSYALCNATFQFAMFLTLKRQGISALPAISKIRSAIYG